MSFDDYLAWERQRNAERTAAAVAEKHNPTPARAIIKGAALGRYVKCESKQRHDSYAKAVRAVKSADMHAYRCNLCNGWHVGGTRAAESKR